MPNFLIVGAMKSGTTSLWRYLQQHSEIYMPDEKEPRFLTSSRLIKSRPIRTFEDYIKLFGDIKEEKAIGEASPHYLYPYSSTIPTIKNYLGDVKIIIILRNPTDRAFSAYKHTFLIEKSETLPFEKCLELEEERKKNEVLPMMHFYKDLGFYYSQVKAYMENFSRVKVCLYDDLSRDALGLAQDLYGFLEVHRSFIPEVGIKHNISPPKNKFLREFLLDYDHPLKKFLRPVLLSTIGINNTEKLVNLFKNVDQIRIKPETRRYLIDLYSEDILKLQDLIQRDLSSWLNKR